MERDALLLDKKVHKCKKHPIAKSGGGARRASVTCKLFCCMPKHNRKMVHEKDTEIFLRGKLPRHRFVEP